jgi:alanine racemase
MQEDLFSWCEVSLGNLDHNVEQIKKLIGKTKFMAVIKANAYGYGLEKIGERLKENKNIDCFGVNTVEEGEILRSLGIKKPIVVISANINKNNLEKVFENDLEIELGSEYLLNLIKDFKKEIKIHIKVDTGINRLGFAMDELEEALEKIKKIKNIKVVGIMSHLASVEEGFIDYTRKQIERFKEAIGIFHKHEFEGVKHLGASSCALACPDGYFDMVRVGVSLYGLWPSEETQQISVNPELELKPLMTFKTRVVHKKRVPKGDRIGYGCTYKAKGDMVIAVLPIGYYESFDRRLSNIGEVLVLGKRAKVIGRVCMNTTMVDITDFEKEVKIGDEVVVFGKSGGDEITAEEFVGKIGTITYELATRIPQFIKRIYKE